MAAPANKTITDLNGRWLVNKKISDDSDPGLKLQGISYATRTLISYASITINVNQYTAPPKPGNDSTDIFTHIDIEQSASGLTSTLEARCLDDTYREHSDWLFGTVKGFSKFVSLAELDSEYLKGGWEVSSPESKELVKSHVESIGNGWTATQIWGFQTVNGERRHCRNYLLVKGEEKVTFRLVYDFLE